MKKGFKISAACLFVGMMAVSTALAMRVNFESEGHGIRAAVVDSIGNGQPPSGNERAEKKPRLVVVLDHETSLRKENVSEIAAKLVNLVELEDTTHFFEHKLAEPSKYPNLWLTFKRVVVFTFAEELDKLANAKILRGISGVESVSDPDKFEVRGCLIPNDPQLSNQWGISKIEADDAWDTNVGSSSVSIGVIDTGCDDSLSDLSGNVSSTLKKNLHTGSNDCSDDSGHGTHVAGIAAARGW